MNTILGEISVAQNQAEILRSLPSISHTQGLVGRFQQWRRVVSIIHRPLVELIPVDASLVHSVKISFRSVSIRDPVIAVDVQIWRTHQTLPDLFNTMIYRRQISLNGKSGES